MPFNLQNTNSTDALHFLHHLKHPSELGEAYLSSGIYHFVSALTGLFVPLYFLNVLGFTLAQVLSFFVAISLVRALWAYPAGLIIAHIGPKHGMIASFPLAFLIYLLLFLLPGNHWLILPIIFFEGFFVALYASSFHVHLSKGSHNKNRGSEISKLLLFNALALAAGPIIGAVIIERFGFPTLLITSMVLLIAASFPLLMSPEIYHKREFDLRKIKFKDIKLDLLGNMFQNIDIIAGVSIWAIFVYFAINDYSLVGGTRSLQLLVAAFAIFFTGKLADKVDRKKLLNLGSTLGAIIEMIRVFMRTAGAILTIDFLRGLVVPLKNIPYIAIYYQHSDEQPRMEYVFYMELFGALAVALLMILGVIVNLMYGNIASLIFLLIMGSVSSLGMRISR